MDREEVGCGGNDDVEMDASSYKAGQGKEQHHYGDNKTVRNIQRYAGNEGPVVRTCNEKRREECGDGCARCRG